MAGWNVGLPRCAKARTPPPTAGPKPLKLALSTGRRQRWSAHYADIVFKSPSLKIPGAGAHGHSCSTGFRIFGRTAGDAVHRVTLVAKACPRAGVCHSTLKEPLKRKRS